MRAISWIKAARKNFEHFPEDARIDVLTALEIAADGRKPASAKPLKGMDSGVLEIALPFRGDAFRVICSADWRCSPGDPRFPENGEDRYQDTAA